MVLKKVVLDVLKSHEYPKEKLSESIVKLRGVKEVSITSEEIDQETESLKVVVEGGALNFEKIKHEIEKEGASVHSIDFLVSRKK